MSAIIFVLDRESLVDINFILYKQKKNHCRFCDSDKNKMKEGLSVNTDF